MGSLIVSEFQETQALVSLAMYLRLEIVFN